MSHSIKFLFSIFLTFLLSACIAHVNPPFIQPYINKPIPSKTDMFVVEAHESFGLPALMAPYMDLRYPEDYFPASADKIPSIATYLKNPAPWHQWKQQGILGMDVRIVGLLRKGTLIIIQKYRIPSLAEDLLDANIHIDILITEGPFKDKHFSISTVELKDMFGISAK